MLRKMNFAIDRLPPPPDRVPPGDQLEGVR